MSDNMDEPIDRNESEPVETRPPAPECEPIEQAAPPRPLFSEWIQNPPHCCLRCGYTPVEGMREYLLIHGEDAKCCRCGEALVGQTDPYPESAAPAAIEQARPQPPERSGNDKCAKCHWLRMSAHHSDKSDYNYHEFVETAAAAEPAPERTPPTLEAIGEGELDALLEVCKTYKDTPLKEFPIRVRLLSKLLCEIGLRRAVAVPEPAAQQESPILLTCPQGHDFSKTAQMVDDDKAGVRYCRFCGEYYDIKPVDHARQAEPAPTPSRSYHSQWDDATINRLITLDERANAVVSAVKAIEYINKSPHGFLVKANAMELLLDGIRNVVSKSDGTEWRIKRWRA